MDAHAPPAPLSDGPAAGGQLARALLVGALVALFVRAFVAAAAVVPSGSMAPAIEAGDRVLVDRMLFAAGLPPVLARLLPVREPRHGDVVWLRSPGASGAALVKRVVALGGERFGDARLPPGHFAVLGDHGANSLDSRAFGALPRGAAIGRVCLVLWSAGVDEGVRGGRFLRPVR